MSLDDKLEGDVVSNVVKGLEITLSMARRVIDDQHSFDDKAFSRAKEYQKEFNHAVWKMQPSFELRKDFIYFANFIAARIKSPKNSMYNFLMLNALGCCMYGYVKDSLSSVALGITGGLAVYALQRLNNACERKSLKSAANAVYNASDDYWKAALIKLHSRRGELCD